jgi:hypothetical protein
MTLFFYWWSAGICTMLCAAHHAMTEDHTWIGDGYRALYTNTPEYFWLFIFMIGMLIGPFGFIAFFL